MQYGMETSRAVALLPEIKQGNKGRKLSRNMQALENQTYSTYLHHSDLKTSCDLLEPVLFMHVHFCMCKK